MHLPLLTLQIPLLSDIIILLVLSVLAILIFHRFRMPSIIGFLAVGILAGPGFLGLVQAQHEIEMLAEIGVILLMFIIGLEFSLASLGRIKRAVFLGGGLQVGLSIAAMAGLTLTIGLAVNEAIFLGFLVSLSSTAIVLKLLQDRLEMESMHGRVILAILIFQDLIVVPMMLLTPLLGGKGGDLWTTLGLMLLKIVGVLGFVLVAARYLMPRLLFLVARTRSKELFILTTLGTCLAVAWLTSEVGLSLALGAFLAGLIISESEYSHEAVSNILPFREIFSSFFFVSIGMLLDVWFVAQHPLEVVSLGLGVIMLKLLVCIIAAWFLDLPIRTVLLVGIGLAQVGEFAFILSKTGLEAGVLRSDVYQYFLAVSIFTMALTPLMLLYADKLTALLMKAPLPKKLRERLAQGPQRPIPVADPAKLKDHLVVIGYGLNGRNLVQAARFGGIPYAIIETNPITVRQERAHGEPILYGDAAQEHVLEQCQIADARVVVIAISDTPASKRIVAAVRHANPSACIIVRTRYVREMEELLRIGASEVIPEELETSIEIFSRVLAKYLVPLPEIDRFVSELRSESYEMMRARSMATEQWSAMQVTLADSELATFEVSDTCDLAGRTLADIQPRQQFGVNLLAIRRDGSMLYDVDGDTQIQPHDTLYVFGKAELVHRFAQQ